MLASLSSCRTASSVQAAQPGLRGSKPKAGGQALPIVGDVRDPESVQSAVAKAVGADHESIEVTEAMVWRHLPEIVACAVRFADIRHWVTCRCRSPGKRQNTGTVAGI